MKVATTFLTLLPFTTSFLLPTPPQSTNKHTIMSAELTRRDALFKTALSTAGLLSLGTLLTTTTAPAPAFAGSEVKLPSGIVYEVLENGSGPIPQVGELAAIRFTGQYKDIVFDDLYKSKEPLYFRVGGGTLLAGIEEVVKLMKVGDRWKLTIPGELAFGVKGRSASPGKPRIPPNAPVQYDLKLVALPGRETEIIDLDSFDENAPASDDSDPNKGLLL